MWFFRLRPQKAWLPPQSTGPESFADWTEEDIDRVSRAIRFHGQPDSPGFRVFARVALNTMRGGSAVELVARAMERSANPGSDPDGPIDPRSGHYQMGQPNWAMWIEYARPAVHSIVMGYREK